MKNEGVTAQGAPIRIEIKKAPWLQPTTSAASGLHRGDSTKRVGAPALFHKPQTQTSK